MCTCTFSWWFFKRSLAYHHIDVWVWCGHTDNRNSQIVNNCHVIIISSFRFQCQIYDSIQAGSANRTTLACECFQIGGYCVIRCAMYTLYCLRYTMHYFVSSIQYSIHNGEIFLRNQNVMYNVKRIAPSSPVYTASSFNNSCLSSRWRYKCFQIQICWVDLMRWGESVLLLPLQTFFTSSTIIFNSFM